MKCYCSTRQLNTTNVVPLAMLTEMATFTQIVAECETETQGTHHAHAL